MNKNIAEIKGLCINRKFKKILKKIPQKNITNKVFVFNTIRIFSKQLHIELFLAFVLAKLGAKVFVLLDRNGCFSHWDCTQKHNENEMKIKFSADFSSFKSILRYFFVYKQFLNLYNHENLKIIDYSDVITNNVPIHKKIVEDSLEIDLEKHAKSSTRRYTETGEIDFSDESHKNYFDMSLRNANISLQMGRFIKNEIKPDVFFTAHGIYSLWGPCFEYLKQSEIKSLVYAGGIKIIDEIFMKANRSKEWKNFKSKELNKQMKNEVICYLDKRRAHQTQDNIDHFKYITKDSLIDTKKSKGFDYVFCAFPNVIWDGDVDDRNHIFDGVLDWLIQIIDFMRENKNYFLYVRCHPSEVTRLKGTKLVEELLLDNIKDLENIQNVEIISSKTNLDTYRFLDQCVNIGLVYDGTLGLELPYMGIPTLMAGDGRINIKGINIGVKTRKQYFDYISKPEKIKQDFAKEFDEEILYKYVYWNQFETAYYMPIIDKKTRRLRLDDVTLSEINIWENAEFKRTIERVLGEKI